MNARLTRICVSLTLALATATALVQPTVATAEPAPAMHAATTETVSPETDGQPADESAAANETPVEASETPAAANETPEPAEQPAPPATPGDKQPVVPQPAQPAATTPSTTVATPTLGSIADSGFANLTKTLSTGAALTAGGTLTTAIVLVAIIAALVHTVPGLPQQLGAMFGPAFEGK
ncbi:hypothetical protein ACFPVT_07375 [Corynebacterium choanae]|uniref:Secreted protein n=1 Tax=Corynebacterium choanae TaxID=1862358 RepID=A0A3G6J7Q5_9CORY|nr:hypothetical protein [Corynebacterium choanae]AZA13919.1 hypothetical protein CCHOA_07635 [Corynebacterium choanae]